MTVTTLASTTLDLTVDYVSALRESHARIMRDLRDVATLCDTIGQYRAAAHDLARDLLHVEETMWAAGMVPPPRPGCGAAPRAVTR